MTEIAKSRPDEFIQCAGRAGRRGKDTSGSVILGCWKSGSVNPKHMMTAAPKNVTSHFHIDDSLVLSLHQHLSTVHVDDILRASLMQEDDRPAGALLERIRKRTAALAPQMTRDSSTISMRLIMPRQYREMPYPSFGARHQKVAQVRGEDRRRTRALAAYAFRHDVVSTNDIMITVEEEQDAIRADWVIEFKSWKLSAKRVAMDAMSLYREWREALDELERAEQTAKSAIDKFSSSDNVIMRLKERQYLLRAAKSIESQLSCASLIPEYEEKVAELRRAGFLSIDSSESLTVKGKAAVEVRSVSCRPTIVIEWLLSGNAPKSKEIFAAMASTFVFKKRARDAHVPPEFNEYLESARKAAACMHGASVSSDVVRSAINPGLVQVVYLWSCGETFTNVMAYTEQLPGTVVRELRRVAELLKELKNVGAVLGNAKISELAEAAEESVRRGIVICPSLYLL